MLFQKPKVDQKEYLANLQAEIFRITEELEKIKTRFAQAYIDLENEFSSKKAQKEKEIDELENKLSLMRSERVELEKPIEYKRKELNERESELKVREIEGLAESQKAYEREREAERKLESVQELADELGETRVRHMVKEKLLKGREDGLKDKEAQYILKVEHFNQNKREATSKLEEKEKEILFKELNVQGKEENLERREKELLEGYVLLNDRRTLLEKGFKELKEKQHGSPKRT